MAVTAGVAAGVGVAAAAGATAAAIRAQKMKTQPRGVVYGGTKEAQDERQLVHARGIDQGNAGYKDGQLGLNRSQWAGRELAAAGTGIMQGATPYKDTHQAAGILNSYRPGEMAALQARQAQEQAANANLGAARSGGALGLRNALTANAASGVEVAQGAALLRSQEEQQLLQLRAQQANADREAQMAIRDQVLRQQQAGAGIAQAGNAQALQASGMTGQLGLTNQGQYLDQSQAVEDRQFMANMDYEQRRQSDQQRKSQNLWGLAGNLVGVSGSAFGAMGGGGGGK